MLLFRASVGLLASSLLSASMLFSGCAAPQNSGDAFSGSSTPSSNGIFSSMSSKDEFSSAAPDSSFDTDNTDNIPHTNTLNSAVNTILDDIIFNYVGPFYFHFYCRESQDFLGYTIDAIPYSDAFAPQLCIETEWLQDGYGCSYYMVHFYSREYDPSNHMLNKKTVNRYVISLPDGKIIPMLDKNGNFIKEYNDMIK